MKTGFLILNYNSSSMTVKLAREIEKCSIVDLIVIVDNKSTDKSLECIQEVLSDRIILICTDKNGGYSYGNNIGLKYFFENKYDIVMVANPDIYIEDNTLIEIVDDLSNSDYSVLSPVEYDSEWNMVEPPTNKRMRYWDDVIDCFYLGRKFLARRIAVELNNNVKIQQTEMLRGSFLAFNLRDFEKVGFFDENVFLYCEERILSKKMSDYNFKMGLLVKEKYQHNHMASIVKVYSSISEKIKILYESRIYYNRKYLKIGFIKFLLLSFAMKISLVEYWILDVKNRLVKK